MMKQHVYQVSDFRAKARNGRAEVSITVWFHDAESLDYPHRTETAQLVARAVLDKMEEASDATQHFTT